MKGLVGIALVAMLVASVGCGGHEGGAIDISENPYQVTEAEQAQMNRANQAPEELLEADAAENTGDSPTVPPPITQDAAKGDGSDSYDPQ